VIDRVIDWLFRNRRTGEITVAQFPNLALWIFIVAAVVRRLAGHGSNLERFAGHSANGALAWWAVDEVVRGVNPWRRLCGAGVVGYLAARVVGGA
jgi:hypothetical protein